MSPPPRKRARWRTPSTLTPKRSAALVILAAWQPLRAVLGAYLFGLLFFLQFRLQGSVPIPSEAFAAMPYLLVILVLALSGRTRAPKALGIPFERGR
jgi:simple sugar transport system permease protein